VSLAAKILELGERIKSLTLIPSSGGAFEIRANGKLLHSKLDTGDWPDFDAIVTAKKKKKKSFPNPQFEIRNPESEGCLVVLAVFKTVVGSAYRDRGRFDSYPLRFNFSRHPERKRSEVEGSCGSIAR